jgi:hypothetical protein
MSKEKNTTTSANYSATIAETNLELTAREKIKFKDTQNAVSLLDFATDAKNNDAKAIVENIQGYVVLDIHNEKSDDIDYKNYLIIDGNGDKYVTGSNSFFNAFMAIFTEMKDEKEPWSIELNLLPSKNYKGKEILTCSLV